MSGMFKRWALTTWLLEKSGNWDCVDARDLDGPEVVVAMKSNTAQYGEPETVIGFDGETVSFTWKDGSDAKIVLRQKPCD